MTEKLLTAEEVAELLAVPVSWFIIVNTRRAAAWAFCSAFLLRKTG
jgi:hypothetical protein